MGMGKTGFSVYLDTMRVWSQVGTMWFATVWFDGLRIQDILGQFTKDMCCVCLRGDTGETALHQHVTLGRTVRLWCVSIENEP